MRSPVRRCSSRALLALFAAVLVAAGCANSSDHQAAASKTTASPTTAPGAQKSTAPGVSESEIRFGAIGTTSNNPLGTCVLECFADGVKAYFAYRNDQGGAFGHKLVLPDLLDDELAKNKERSLEVISANKDFGVFDAPELPSGFDDLDKAGIPVYAWGIHHTEMNGHQGIFSNVGVYCITCTMRYPVYIAQQAGAKRIATLGYSASDSSKDCADGQAASVKKYHDQTEQQVVYTKDDLEFGLPNGIGPEVSAMKDAKVDFIMGCIDLNGMKTLAEELKRQGMGDVPALHQNSYDQGFIKDAGDLFEGDYVAIPIRPFEADTPGTGIGPFKTWMKKTGSELTELALDGWINADLAFQGIISAGPNFDRQRVIKATNAMTKWSADGLINPVDWSRQHIAPTEDDPTTHGYVKECMSIVRITKGEFKVVGDPAKPFTCWSNKNRDWAKPELTSTP